MIERNLGRQFCSGSSHRIIKAVATMGMRPKGAFICLFELPALGGKMSVFERSEFDILVRRTVCRSRLSKEERCTRSRSIIKSPTLILWGIG